MAITTRSSGSLADFTETPNIASVAAQTDDWIWAFWAWRGTGGGGGTDVTLGTPTWNGLSMTQVGSTLQLDGTGNLQAAAYKVKATSNATATITAAFTGTGSNFAIVVMGYSVEIGVNGTTPNDTPQTQVVWSSYSSPSLTVGSMAADDKILEFIADIGWDSSFNDTSASTWSTTNSQSSVFDRPSSPDSAGTPHLRLYSKTGTGSVNVGFTASAGSPGYVHMAFRLIGVTATTKRLRNKLITLNVGS